METETRKVLLNLYFYTIYVFKFVSVKDNYTHVSVFLVIFTTPGSINFLLVFFVIPTYCFVSHLLIILACFSELYVPSQNILITVLLRFHS